MLWLIILCDDESYQEIREIYMALDHLLLRILNSHPGHHSDMYGCVRVIGLRDFGAL